MKVGLIMGSDSDFPVMKKAIAIFKEFGVEYEVLLASAHRTPAAVREFVSTAEERGISAFVVGAGMAAHLCGVIASMTTVPVIGVPINSSLDGMDALLAIVQMPPGIPVATVGINASLNSAILAMQILAQGDPQLDKKLADYKEGLKQKIVKANADLAKVEYKFKTN